MRYTRLTALLGALGLLPLWQQTLGPRRLGRENAPWQPTEARVEPPPRRARMAITGPVAAGSRQRSTGGLRPAPVKRWPAPAPVADGPLRRAPPGWLMFCPPE